METIYFIILNYNTEKETINCIDSIRKLDKSCFLLKIIIIDNCSNDLSFQNLKMKYRDDVNIELYKMEENLGFSKANNFAYRIIKERKNARFCVVCNSDVEFIQEDFILRIQEEFICSNFFVCGMDVFCKTRIKSRYRGHQSPAYPFEWNKTYIKLSSNYYKIKIKKIKNEDVNIFQYLFALFSWVIIYVITSLLILTKYRNYREKRHENIPIHGSCIIISDYFINEEDYLFYPETLFYGEELLLYLRIKYKKYKVVYNPKIKISHLQGKSTNSINSQEREIFKYLNVYNSAMMYLDELKKYRR